LFNEFRVREANNFSIMLCGIGSDAVPIRIKQAFSLYSYFTLSTISCSGRSLEVDVFFELQAA
jgi:hypothetical protein